MAAARQWAANEQVQRLFRAEIANERDGGVSPATLTSTIDSLAQGGAEVFEMDADAVIALLMVRDLLAGDTEIAGLLA